MPPKLLPRARLLFALLFSLILVAGLAPRTLPAIAADRFVPTRVGSSALYVHTPDTIGSEYPANVLVLLHGMGGNGPDLAAGWLDYADRQGWVVVAPTLSYGDWFDPAAVRADDIRLTDELAGLLEELPSRLGRPVAQRALIFGFSRGAQLAHRFALYYPQHTQAVAALSAGTYTLPDTELTLNGRPTLLPLPFGVGDMDRWVGHPCNERALTRVKFWIGVGASDNRAADVPRQWDAYIGADRVTRARSFTSALDRHRVQAHLTVFPGAGHEITQAIRASASQFLATAARVPSSGSPFTFGPNWGAALAVQPYRAP